MKLTLEEATEMMAANNGNLNIADTDYTELPEGLSVGGWLDLSCTPITKLPEGLSVGGGLELYGTPITELPEGLSIGGWFNLSHTQITKLPEGLSVGGWLDLRDTPITELPEGLSVGGGLDLRFTPIAELPEGLIVGGDLVLSGTQITKLPEGLTIGGSLYLRDTPITKLPDGLSVGGSISGFLGCTSHIKRLENGDFVPGRYLYADGILTHVKRKKNFQNYDYFIGKIPGRNVLSDGTYYVHCGSIRDGIRDLAFKRAKNRGADQFRDIGLDDLIPTDDMVAMYRVITGACQQGTEHFLQSLGRLKESYTVREAIALTEGQYGADQFREFFGL